MLDQVAAIYNIADECLRNNAFAAAYFEPPNQAPLDMFGRMGVEMNEAA
jgi:hypothetical protein